MGDPTSRRKCFKLKSPVTRDSFLQWSLNHQSFCRQDPTWTEFLPGGTDDKWSSYDEDETRGIYIWEREADGRSNKMDTFGQPILDKKRTNKIRTALTEQALEISRVGTDQTPTNREEEEAVMGAK